MMFLPVSCIIAILVRMRTLLPMDLKWEAILGLVDAILINIFKKMYSEY